MNELTNAARLILDNCGISFSQNRIVRLVLQFKERAPHANGYVFFQFLTNAVQMSNAQQQAALLDPNIARVIAYADPTGETAVNNVIRQGSRG
jgi:ABC-type phosphate transport system substrate-binding protein